MIIELCNSFSSGEAESESELESESGEGGAGNIQQSTEGKQNSRAGRQDRVCSVPQDS